MAENRIYRDIQSQDPDSYCRAYAAATLALAQGESTVILDTKHMSAGGSAAVMDAFQDMQGYVPLRTLKPIDSPPEIATVAADVSIKLPILERARIEKERAAARAFKFKSGLAVGTALTALVAASLNAPASEEEMPATGTASERVGLYTTTDRLSSLQARMNDVCDTAKYAEEQRHIVVTDTPQLVLRGVNMTVDIAPDVRIGEVFVCGASNRVDVHGLVDTVGVAGPGSYINIRKQGQIETVIADGPGIDGKVDGSVDQFAIAGASIRVDVSGDVGTAITDYSSAGSRFHEAGDSIMHDIKLDWHK